jgi:phosphoribosylformylglycinamidine synthase
MSQPRVAILRTAGTNCDEETAFAWRLAGADPHRVHVRELMERPERLDEFAILTVPGGFSYGDDISAGKILANQIVHHLRDAVLRFVEQGKLVLGICNGFQVLVKTGLLPGDGTSSENRSAAARLRVDQSVTLAMNDSARFEARWVRLKCIGGCSAFLPDDELLEMPIAHAEGKLVARDETTRNMLSVGNIALTYCDEAGKPGGYPINPNGSERHIAGLVDSTGRILGLMPHPERHMQTTQHPAWTRRRDARPDGRLLFENGVRHARNL